MIDNLAKLVVDNGGTISPLIIPGELTDGTGLCNVSVFIDDNDDIITNIRHVHFPYTIANLIKTFILFGGV